MTITRREVAIAALGALIGIAVIVAYGIIRTDELKHAFTDNRVDIQTAFFTLADQADRIEAIPESAASVRDCSERGRFEELLSRLPALVRAERTELDVLFASCGDYHARLKAYYADRLDGLAIAYRTNRELHDAVFASDAEHVRTEDGMFALVGAERMRAEDLYLLVRLQQDMNDVYAGRSKRTLSEVTEEARAVEKRLIENDAVADMVRTERK